MINQYKKFLELKQLYVLFFLLSVCCSISWLSSCAGRPPVSQPQDTAVQWEDKKPKEILNRLRAEQSRIRDFSAGFSILMDPPPRGQPSNLQGVLFYAVNKRGVFVRIKSMSPFGRILFDLVQTPGSVQIYIPSRQTLYSGRPETEKDNVWADIFSGLFPDFSALEVPQGASLSIQRRSVILPLMDGAFHLNRKTGLVEKWTRQERTILYEDYTDAGGVPPFPTRITATSRDGFRRVSCTFTQVEINTGNVHMFNLSEYHPKYKKDISELSR